MSTKYSSLDSSASPASPISPNEWPTSDSAPLLLEDTAPEKDEKATECPKVEPEKSSGFTEFKIASSNFLVSGDRRTLRPRLTGSREYFHTLPEMIEYFFSSRQPHPYAPVSRYHL
jgi:hypothetical protein